MHRGYYHAWQILFFSGLKSKRSGTIINSGDYMTEDYIRNRLFEMQDLKYREFHSRLMPTVPKDTVIGVRVPALRKFAKEIKNTDYAAGFLKTLPHKYYEENNLHAFLIEEIKDYSECIKAVNRFLPFVDNWATCDMMRPKCFKRHKKELLSEIEREGNFFFAPWHTL